MEIFKDKEEESSTTVVYFRSYRPSVNHKSAQFRNHCLVTSDPAVIADAEVLVSRGYAVELTAEQFEKANSIEAN